MGSNNKLMVVWTDWFILSLKAYLWYVKYIQSTVRAKSSFQSEMELFFMGECALHFNWIEIYRVMQIKKSMAGSSKNAFWLYNMPWKFHRFLSAHLV